MKKIRDFINNNLVGTWYNKDYKLQVIVNEPDGELYSVDYNPGIPLKNGKIETEEKIRIMYGTVNINFIHFSNCLGSRNLRFISDEIFEVFHEDPETHEVKTCLFSRINNVP